MGPLQLRRLDNFIQPTQLKGSLKDMRTALVFHPLYLRHFTGDGHPERPSRIEAIFRRLKRDGLIDRLVKIEPLPASEDDIAFVHERNYINEIKNTCLATKKGLSYIRGLKNATFRPQIGNGRSVFRSKKARTSGRGVLFLDSDTSISRHSYEAALCAAGGAITAAERCLAGDLDSVFCLVRPPGHHARPGRAMGFCIFNNAAIAATYLLERHRLKRVAIVDWDVHHGNGTEEAFYSSQEVFYISLHQYPHYPGTGRSEDTGAGKGRGYNLNIPMPPGSGDAEYLHKFKDIILPRLYEYRPEFLLISAGFDGHKDDPLSSINLTEEGYAAMTNLLLHAIQKINGSAAHRVVSLLEGGYNLISLPLSVSAHIKTILEF